MGVIADSIIADSIVGLDPLEKSLFKSEELRKVAPTGTIDEGSLSVKIEQIENSDKGLRVFVSAMNAGKKVGFGSDGSIEVEKFNFINPPTMVPNGQSHFALETRPSGASEMMEFFDFEENPSLALSTIVLKKVRDFGKGDENIIVGKIGNTVSTIFSTRDGFLTRNNSLGNEDFTTIRAGAGTSANDTSAASGMGDLLAGALSANYQILTRFCFVFDTSVVGTDTVSSAVLSVFARTPFVIDGLGGNGAIGITSGSLANPASFAASDFENNTSSTRFVTSDLDITTNFGAEQYYNFTFNATGIAAINGSGNSIFAAKLGYDIDNSTTGITWSASGEMFVRMYSYAEAGTTKDPKFVITHSAAAAPTIKVKPSLLLMNVG